MGMFLRTSTAIVALAMVARSASGQTPTALPDGAVARIDAASLRSDGEPTGRLDSLREAVFSPDGSRLAIRGEPEDPTVPRRILVWDVRTRRIVSTIPWNVSIVSRMAFATDAKLAASTPDAPAGVQIWSLADGKELRGLPSGRGPFLVMERGSRVGILAPAGRHEVLRVHLIETGEEAQRFVLPVTYQSEFSPDGLRVAAALRFGDSDVRVLDVRTAKELRVLKGSRPPSVMRFCPDGRTLAAGSADKSAQLWELSSGEPIFRLTGSKGAVIAAAFSPDGRLLAAAGTDPVIHLWEVATGREIHTFVGHSKPVTTLAFSPDGRLLASGGLDRTVVVWDASRASQSFVPPAPPDDKEMTKLWDDLAAASPSAAYPAIGRFRATADATLPLLRERVRLALVPIDRSRIDQLIRNLGDADSIVRHRATDDLRRIREIARPALVRAARESASAEVRARARRLLTMADEQPRFSPGDLRRMQRLVHTVEALRGPDSEFILDLISREMPDAAIARDASETLARIRRQM